LNFIRWQDIIVGDTVFFEMVHSMMLTLLASPGDEKRGAGRWP